MNRITPVVLACIASVSLIVIAPGASTHAVNVAQSYVVRPGDTLLAIAVRFDVSVTTLQAANNLNNPDQLQIGQTLVIPLVGASKRATLAVAQTVVVQAGDTLSGIALKYGIDMAELMRASPSNWPGQRRARAF